MDPVSAGVGLAASLATLIGIGSKSYTALSTLTSQMKSAPERIRELCRKVRRLEELLSAVHTFVDRIRDDELPPNVRKWWNANMNDITANLKALEQLAERLNVLHKQAISNGSKFSARIKTVLSSDEIAKYETSIESNIKELDRLGGYLDSWKLHEAQTTLRSVNTHTQSASASINEIQPALVREIRSNFASFEPIINARFDSVNQAIETVRNHVLATHVSLRRVQFSGQGEPSTYPPGTWRIHPSARQRRGRPPHWDIDIFDLPIGALVVEMSKGGHIGTSENAQMHSVAFRFKPKPWMADGIFSVEHFFSIAANSSPTWQRVQRRVPSIIPKALLNALEGADLLQLGSILSSSFSFDSLELMLENEFLPRDYLWSAGIGRGADDSLSNFSFSFGSLPESSSISITNRADLRWINRGPQSKPMLVCKDGRLEALNIYFFEKILQGEPHEWPTMLVPPDDQGYRFFMQHVCPCLDSMEFEELDRIDKWWLSALNHEDPRFGAAIQSHLYHLDESDEHSPATLKRVTGKAYLDYHVAVDEILAASHAERQNFLCMVYASCTTKCLRPFLDSGHDPSTVLGTDNGPSVSFYQVAVQAQNIPVIQELNAKGLPLSTQDIIPVYPPPFTIDFRKEQELVNAILLVQPKENESTSSLVYFYCSVEHAHSSKYWQNKFLYLSDLRNFATDELYKRGLGSYCHPPYRRWLFLGPELLLATMEKGREHTIVPRLLFLGASLDYAGPTFLPHEDQRTPLAWSIDLGRADLVVLMAIAASNFEDHNSSLRAGLRRAKMHLDTKHPRHFSVPMPYLPSLSDPVSRWEMKQLERSRSHWISGEVFQPREVSRIQDILSYTVLELAVSGGPIGQTKLAAMAREFGTLHKPFNTACAYGSDDIPGILTRFAELAGVDEPQIETPEQGRLSRLKRKFIRLMGQIRHYRLSTLKRSWSRVALAAVGLTLCLRAMLQHILYEFIAWVWIQRAGFKRLWPFLLLSTIVLFAAWVV